MTIEVIVSVQDISGDIAIKLVSLAEMTSFIRKSSMT